MAKTEKQVKKTKEEKIKEEMEARIAERSRVLGIKSDIAISSVLEMNEPTVSDLVTFGADVIVRIARFIGGQTQGNKEQNTNIIIEQIVRRVREAIPEPTQKATDPVPFSSE